MANQRRSYTSTPGQWERLKPYARAMRHDPTPAEDALWQRLRNRQVAGAKFRRQHAIAGFIVDFVCIEARLIVEVDGAVHDEAAVKLHDAQRQVWLEDQGYRVLRVSNAAVLHEPDAVVAAVAAALTSP